MRFLKWFYPGMRVKRWVVLALGGVLCFGIGAALLTVESNVLQRAMALLFLLAGLCSVSIGVLLTLRSLLDVVSPADQDLVERVFQRRHLEKGPKIVAVGGGTGLSTLLQGLKQYTANITAVVTVADDGGSSGRLREEFDVLPPGDIRNCLVALADTEPLMQELFQYRFTEESPLKGHSFGNLFITAMTKITGDFERAIQASSKVLAIRGRVVPATNSKVRLTAEHDDGTRTVGETNISNAEAPIRRIYLEPAGCQPSPEALDAIRDAHAIVFGPGSLYTSIIPNLLVDNMVDAIVQSKALKIYICNVMTQFRETRGYRASDHIRALTAHTHPGVVQYCIVNTGKVPPELLERYREEEAFPVDADAETIESMGYHVVAANIVNIKNHVRHDSDQLAKVIVQLIIGARNRFAGGAASDGPASRHSLEASAASRLRAS